MSDDSSVESLPLFPLHAVLYPGMPLPLHIFEPRYRLMIGQCLERSTQFGVVLIRAGREVGEAATPYEVGTTAEILEHTTLDDGRMHLVCIGRERFRIRRLIDDESYLSAAVEPVVDRDESDTVARASELARSFGAVAAGADPARPIDPTALSFAIARALPLPLPDQQRLLEMTSAIERLAALRALIQRERELRARVGETRPAHPTSLGEVSSN